MQNEKALGELFKKVGNYTQEHRKTVTESQKLVEIVVWPEAQNKDSIVEKIVNQVS